MASCKDGNDFSDDYSPALSLSANGNILVTGITLSQTSLSLSMGGNQTISATVEPSNATDQRVTWSSSNTAVAMVSAAGLVTAIAAGSCTITCTAQDGSGVKATCSVTVTSGSDSDTHAYVDLGLPSGTLWATCNIGASKPEDYGDYFAWGETTGYNSGKTDFDVDTYKYCNGSLHSMTKYCTSSSYGTVDNKTELELADDAAYVNWGSQWRMPSYEQLTELRTECTWTWTTRNGVYGYEVKGTNGNSIFLPAAGRREDTWLYHPGSYGDYWSRTLETSDPSGACSLFFSLYDLNVDSDTRYFGQSVRPVRASENILVTGITLSQTSLSLSMGGNQTISATVEPSNATDQRVTWSSSNTAVAMVSAAGLVTAIAAGSCTITCTAQDGSGVKATCSVTVDNVDNSGSINGRAYVDLGLPSGTLWATCNLGASKPGEYGDYFAWGETTGYNSGKTDFSWSTYKYCNGSSFSMTKYCTDSSYGTYGTVDNKTELELADDAAYVNWGSQWRMPSDEQQTELRTECTWTWTTRNGVYGYEVYGYEVKGTNGNSIFLPAAGERDDTSLYNAGSYGYYWSRTLSTGGFPNSAYNLSFYSSSIIVISSNRFKGRSVRPVRASE